MSGDSTTAQTPEEGRQALVELITGRSVDDLGAVLDAITFAHPRVRAALDGNGEYLSQSELLAMLAAEAPRAGPGR